jgi:hypothetical protein
MFERVSPNSNIASYDERYTSGKPTQLSRFDLLAHHVICLLTLVEHEVKWHCLIDPGHEATFYVHTQAARG